jgi:hypothetical protein
MRGEESDEEKKGRLKTCWSKVKKLIWFKPNDTIQLFSTSKKFEVFIVFVIICNAVVLGSEHYDQPEWLTTF